MGRILKRSAIVLVILLVLLAITYWILSSITARSIDKTVEVAPPSSPKSVPEYYAFGYQPQLTYSEERAACSGQTQTKKALFGDLHIHTAVSADAFPDGTRTFPADVYKFAQGQEIQLPGTSGPKRKIRLERPLDFAAVTDHAETFGEGYICRTKGAFPGYDTASCETFRAGGEDGVREFMRSNSDNFPTRNEQVCGKDYADCKAADKIVWQEMVRAAEDAYDRSATCKFTSFVGYEYTRSPNGHHMHRNTIFKNAEVPARPATHFSHPGLHGLLTSFEEECRLGIENCDVISIPHNSNISGGNAFSLKYMDGFSEQSQQAFWQLRGAYDRLMEITQHKGTSECLNGASDILGDVDELCNVEALRRFGKEERVFDVNTILPSIGTGDSPECRDEDVDPKDNLYKGFCLAMRDFARGALLYGMAQEMEGGSNPFEFGFIGSTDTHIGAGGNVREPTWPGHIAYETTLKGRLGEAALGRYNRLVSNPGGLAGVYATENSRDAIFQGMKRREAFATTGTRIEPRFFAGRYRANICAQDGWLRTAYASGTPMGSKMPAQDEAFQLLVQAKGDPMSKPLEKLQLIKGWIDANGQKQFKVVDLPATRQDDSLCVLYEDADYDPALSTYYYMRAVEQPSQRWSKAQCHATPAGKRPVECSNDMPGEIVEMAWGSPIWFTPRYKPELPVG